jgi:hypothetical protein
LAGDYAGYYLNAWEFFLSGHRDIEAAHRALQSGVRVLQRGHAIGMAAPD